VAVAAAKWRLMPAGALAELAVEGVVVMKIPLERKGELLVTVRVEADHALDLQDQAAENLAPDLPRDLSQGPDRVQGLNQDQGQEVDRSLVQDHGHVQSRGLDLSQVLDLKVVLGQDQVLLNQDLEHGLGQDLLHALGQVLVDQEHVLGQLAHGLGLDLPSQAQDPDREVQLALDLGHPNQGQLLQQVLNN